MRWIEIALLAACVSGCTASVHGPATPRAAGGGSAAALDAELEAEVRAERELTSSEATTTTANGPASEEARRAAPAPSAAESAGSRLALLGARHDLRLRSSADATCRCLAVRAGQPSDPMFVWETLPPQLDADSQMVVAFAGDTQACGGSGAAYRGYQSDAGDVVVLIEAAAPGRPALSGAIVPRPQGEGRLWIQPTPSTLAYGQPLQGEPGRCAVSFDGAPGVGAARSIATSKFADDDGELATNGPADDGPEEIPLDEGPHSPRDGFYLSVQPALEYPMVDLSVGTASASASGIGFGFDLLIGTSVAPGLTVGGAIGGAAAPQPELTWTLPSGERTSERLDGASLNVFRLGALVDYYPFSKLGFHALVEAGYVSASISGASTDSETLHGFGASGGLGWDFWVSYHLSLGLLARLQWALLRGDGSEGTALLSPALAATLTFH